MSILDKLKKTKEDGDEVTTPVVEASVVAESKEPKAKKPAATKSTTKKADERFAIERSVLVKPLITEKAAMLSAHNQYCFAVRRDANKIMVAKAIEAVYHVTPTNVRMINKRGKTVRAGKTQGVTKAWKKAVVTLKPEDKIQIYEGV